MVARQEWKAWMTEESGGDNSFQSLVRLASESCYKCCMCFTLVPIRKLALWDTCSKQLELVCVVSLSYLWKLCDCQAKTIETGRP